MHFLLQILYGCGDCLFTSLYSLTSYLSYLERRLPEQSMYLPLYNGWNWEVVQRADIYETFFSDYSKN